MLWQPPWTTGYRMKRAAISLTLGISLGLALAMPLPNDAEAGTVTNLRTRQGNWVSGRGVRKAPPPARVQKRRTIDFFGFLRPAPSRNRARPGQPLPPGAAPRTLFPIPFVSGRQGRFAARPVPIGPDAPVEEYVEKPKIYVYPEPALVALKDPRLAGDGPIARVLRAGLARVEVTPKNRRAILAFYKARNFAPVWTNGGDVLPKGQAVLALLARAHEHGLNDDHYRVPVVWENGGDASAISGNPANLARLDVELTAMALRLAQHLSGGVVNPNKLSSYHDLKPPKVSAPKALKKLAETADAAGWIESLAPTHFAYDLMKKELAKLVSGTPENLLPPIPMGRLIRPGMRDERMKLIRQHLSRLGLLAEAAKAPAEQGNGEVTAEPTAGEAPGETGMPDGSTIDGNVVRSGVQPANAAGASVARNAGAGDPLLYDRTMQQAVRRFQKMAGLKPDGLIGKGTIRALNRRNSGGSRKERIAKLRLNMERLRWMPRDFGNPHFLVNVPAFEVYLYENGKVTWKSRVIVGKPKNQTAFFSDRIEYVVFNPYWGVPQSIIRKEFIPKLMKDPYWLDKEGYEVRDSKGRVISSASVDWARYRNAKRIPFDIRQLPGDNNALGRIKVLFPNKHAIYMHDTPFKSLFRRRVRAFSHGCVRVQKPAELAELVSGLDPFEIENYLKAGKNKQMKLKRTIPVHIAYFTAWPDERRRMRYYDDIYGRDRLLKKALLKHDAAYRRTILQADLR